MRKFFLNHTHTHTHTMLSLYPSVITTNCLNVFLHLNWGSFPLHSLPTSMYCSFQYLLPVRKYPLESHLDWKEIQPVHPKGDQSWLFIERTDVDAETPIFWPPEAKCWLIGKDPDARKDWGQEEKGTTEDEMVGWHHQLDGHGFGWTPGVGDGQGGLACCGSWGHKESDTTEWTELNWWTLTFEYHIAFTYHKVLFFEYFQPFKNVKTILSSQAI